MNGDAVRRLTGAARVADRRFEEVGGTTQTHVRDCLVPALDEANLAVVDAELLRALLVEHERAREVAEAWRRGFTARAILVMETELWDAVVGTDRQRAASADDAPDASEPAVRRRRPGRRATHYENGGGVSACGILGPLHRTARWDCVDCERCARSLQRQPWR